MKKIAIFSDNLKVGGIQKSLANFLKSGALDEYETDVFLYDKEIFFDLGDLKENVSIHYLPPMPFWCKGVPFDLLYRFAALPAALPEKEYDLAVDFDSYQNATALGALKVKAKKRVMWIHNDVGIKRREEKKYDLLFRIMKGKYKYFDAFAAVSPGIVASFRAATGQKTTPITVIQNPVAESEIREKCQEESPVTPSPEKLNLVSVGRLCHQKGYDLLLEDLAKVKESRSDVVLYLVGDGPDREMLSEKVKALGLESSVHFMGNMANPFPLMEQMDAFCLTSRYEGQGIVFWEAYALGLPLIFPRHLEKYNPGLEGCDDVVTAILSAKKTEKTPVSLASYNENILCNLKLLIEE